MLEMIFGRPGQRWRGSKERAGADGCPSPNPQECRRCSSPTSSHAWFVIAPPRSDPEPGLYCQNCAEAVGIVDEILQRSGDTEIEIPPEASTEQEYRPAGETEEARPAALRKPVTTPPLERGRQRLSRIARLPRAWRVNLDPEPEA